MARIFGLIANRIIRLPELKEIDCELTRLSGVTGFKSGSIITPDRKVYFSYREKNNHKFKYLKDETEKIYLIVGGAPIKNSKIIEWRWVKGHSGDHGNEKADYLATSASK